MTVLGRIRAALPLGLLGGFHLIVLAILGAEGLIVVPMVLAFVHRASGTLAVASEMLAVGGVPGLVLIIYGVFFIRPSDGPWVSVAVSREQAPALWDLVDEVAAQVGTRGPVELRVAAMANAAVAERTRLLGLVPGPRRLHLGIPLLLGLSAQELRAVLAHEMGHFAGEHTGIGARVHAGSSLLRGVSGAMRAIEEPRHKRAVTQGLWWVMSLHGRIASRILSAYSTFYDRVSLPIRRRQEIEADTVAAGQYSARVMISALQAARTLPVAWQHFVEGYLEPMRVAGYVVDDPFSAFETMLHDEDCERLIARFRASGETTPSSPYDSHPSLQERIDHLVRLPATSEPDDSLPASRLLVGDQRRQVFQALGRAMTPRAQARGKAMPWREWLQVAAERRADNQIRSLVRSAQRYTGSSAPTLDAVLELVLDDMGQDLESALTEHLGLSEPDLDEKVLLTTAVAALVGRYLAAPYRAEWRLDWTHPGRLAAGSLLAEQIQDLTFDAIAHPAAGIPDLRRALQALAVDPSAEVPAARTEGPNAAPGPHLDTTVAARIATLRAVERVLAVAMALIGIVTVLRGNAAAPSYARPTNFVPGVPLNYPTSFPGQLSNPYLVPPLGTFTYPRPSFRLGTLPSGFPTFSALINVQVLVKAGDSLSSLACRYGTTVPRIQTLNKLGSSTVIFAGERLTVPSRPLAARIKC